jgi:GntR family transcriptional regulator, carbon starvation induced regulator
MAMKISKDLAASRAEAKWMTSNLAEKIKSDILACVYLPGERLGTGELGKRYAVGLNPLREALSRLAFSGLVQVQDQKGFRVAPVSKDDLLDVTRQRVFIEGQALKLSIELGDMAWEGRIVSAHHQLSRATIARTDGSHDSIDALHAEFHRALVASCGSKWLLHFRDILWDQSARYRSLSMIKRPEKEGSNEHEALMSATLSRDVDKAVKVLSRHLNRTATLALEGLEEGLGRYSQKTRNRRLVL